MARGVTSFLLILPIFCLGYVEIGWNRATPNSFRLSYPLSDKLSI